MGCNLGNSRGRVDVSASLGALTSPGISHKLPCTLADGRISSDSSGSWKCRNLLRRIGLEQCDSVGLGWPTVSGNSPQDFKMSLAESYCPARLLAFLQTQSVRYLAEHGVGFHPAALGSFLKSVVLVKGRLKYTGSSILVVIVIH